MNEALKKTLSIKKSDAFAGRRRRGVSIDYQQHNFRFTRRWFRLRNQATWSKYFPAKLPPDRPHNVIQIGVFEGMDLVWLMQNCLWHSDSRVLAVDPWLHTRKLDAEWMEGCYQRAVHNLFPWIRQVRIERGRSEEVLPQVISSPFSYRGRTVRVGEWDVVIIDGDHSEGAVMQDAENALQLVRPGGWLVFDDVRNRIYKEHHVFHGLVRWLEDRGDDVRLAWYHRFCNCYEKLG